MSASPEAPNEGRRGVLKAAAYAAICVSGAVSASVMTPTREIAVFGEAQLEDLVPKAFADWRVDTTIVPILPDPSTLAALDRIYSQVLSRTYIDSQGNRIMLSLAYGRRQNDTMRLHQPEGCYRGQGFSVRMLGADAIDLGDRELPVMRLQTALGNRDEPVTYWMVVGGRHAITQFQAKRAKLAFGLRGYIPDGLLFRVSSIDRDTSEGFQLQDRFVRDLLAAVPPAARGGFIGA